MKTVLVTGANGLVGQNLTKLLKKNGFDVKTTDLVGSVDYLGDLINPIFVKDLPTVDVVINCAAVQYVSQNIPIFYRANYFYKNKRYINCQN